MMLSDKDISLITKHLKGELSAIEKDSFDTRLRSESFRKELLNRAELIDSLNAIDEEIIKEGFKKLNTTALPVPSKSSSIKTIGLIIFAALALLVSLWFAKSMTSNSEIQYAQLVDTYQSIYPPQDIGRGQNGELPPEGLGMAMKEYVEGNYKIALTSFEAINPRTNNLKLYMANCLIGLNDFKSAKTMLGSMEQDLDPKVNQNKDWYLIICELGLENKSRVNSLLDQIKNSPNHIFKDKAKGLSQDIK